MIARDFIEEYTIENLRIEDIDNIPLIAVVKVTDNLWGRLDKLINKYYNGEMKYLKSLMDFNKISDPTDINLGMSIKIPELNYIENNTVLNTILDENNIPGVNSSTDNKVVNKSNQKVSTTNSKKTSAFPKLALTINKVTYDSSTGVITL